MVDEIQPEFVPDDQPALRAEIPDSLEGHDWIVHDGVGSVAGLSRVRSLEDVPVEGHVPGEGENPGEPAFDRGALGDLENDEAAGSEPAHETVEHLLRAVDVFEDVGAEDDVEGGVREDDASQIPHDRVLEVAGLPQADGKGPLVEIHARDLVRDSPQVDYPAPAAARFENSQLVSGADRTCESTLQEILLLRQARQQLEGAPWFLPWTWGHGTTGGASPTGRNDRSPGRGASR